MRLRFILAAVALLLAGAGPTFGEGDGVTLPLEGPAERASVTYECRAGDEGPAEAMKVEYVNLPDNALAILEVDGRPTLFVNVVAGSGGKYVSGPFVWWTKGSRGELMNEMAGDSAATLVCREG